MLETEPLTEDAIQRLVREEKGMQAGQGSVVAAAILRRDGLEPTLVLGGMVGWLERKSPTEKAPKVEP